MNATTRRRPSWIPQALIAIGIGVVIAVSIFGFAGGFG